VSIEVFDHPRLLDSIQPVRTSRVNGNPVARRQFDLRRFPGIQVHEREFHPAVDEVEILLFVQVVMPSPEEAFPPFHGKIAEVPEFFAVLDKCQFPLGWMIRLTGITSSVSGMVSTVILFVMPVPL